MEALLKRELGCDFVKATGHSGGGCISQGQSYDTDRGRVFVKVNSKAEVRAAVGRARAGWVVVGVWGLGGASGPGLGSWWGVWGVGGPGFGVRNRRGGRDSGRGLGSWCGVWRVRGPGFRVWGGGGWRCSRPGWGSAQQGHRALALADPLAPPAVSGRSWGRVPRVSHINPGGGAERTLWAAVWGPLRPTMLPAAVWTVVLGGFAVGGVAGRYFEKSLAGGVLNRDWQ